MPPEVERIDGVDWVTLTYTRGGVQHRHRVRTDVGGVDASQLDLAFRLANCVYPKAVCARSEYTGCRWDYESAVNDAGWRLCWLNPEIRGQRGLIQRAAHCLRNMVPELRSRRAARGERIAKGLFSPRQTFPATTDATGAARATSCAAAAVNTAATVADYATSAAAAIAAAPSSAADAAAAAAATASLLADVAGRGLGERRRRDDERSAAATAAGPLLPAVTAGVPGACVRLCRPAATPATVCPSLSPSPPPPPPPRQIQFEYQQRGQLRRARLRVDLEAAAVPSAVSAALPASG
ncbi:hypothetical protein HK405_002430, partial [Cladochytrium tenue]